MFEGVFLDRLKYATIVLLYKRFDRNTISNYRPISILTSFNKVFEKVMYSRLIKHLNKNNILNDHQVGFQENLGTDNAIFRLISEILNSPNQKKKLVGGIFCDLEKVFDCVCHKVLLDKLKYYGINDKQYNLYKSYLQDRFQRTIILNALDNKKVFSNWVRVNNGVPQGSVLGATIVYNIYK
jgi:hypothetical protein